jgi:hypothetical protein
MKRALFSMTIYHYAREVGPVAEHFARKGIDVHILVGWRGETADGYAADCATLGMTVHRLPDELALPGSWRARDESPEPEKAPPVARRGASGRLRSAVGVRVYNLYAFASDVRRMRRARLTARELLERVAPDVVIGSSYRTLGEVDDGLARVAVERSIPYCCVPQSAYLGERNAIEGRRTQLETGMYTPAIAIDHSLANRLYALLWPSWTRKAGDKRIFSWLPKRMFAAWLNGLLAKNVWQQPSELYDLCFVESDFSRRMLLDSGYDAAKVVVVGKPVLDRVFAKRNDPDHERSLYADLVVREGSPFVLFNVEPSYEHRYTTWDEHWARFHGWMTALKRTGLDVVLSLHPMCNPRDYRFVQDEYGFVLSERHKIGDLYPYCGVSVSFPCSTNVFAELFRTPLVIYDWVGLTKEDYPRSDLFRLPGATYAYDADELVDRIAEVARRPEFGARAETSLNGWIPASERILQEIERRFAILA